MRTLNEAFHTDETNEQKSKHGIMTMI